MRYTLCVWCDVIEMRITILCEYYRFIVIISIPLNRICKQTWFCQHWMWLISTRSLHWNWNDGKSIKTKCKIQLFNLLHIRIALFENQSNIIGNLLRHYRVFANFDLIHNISFSEYFHTTHCIIDGKGSNILN